MFDVWNDEIYGRFVAHLKSLADEKYRLFQKTLIPTVDAMLGVRLPALKTLAKEIAKGDFRGFLRLAGDETYEETMVQGLVIGFAKMDVDETLEHIKTFVPKIDNWGVCDSFCASLKITQKHKGEMFDFLLPYLRSKREFDVRFACVMLMDYFITDEYIDRVLALYGGVKSEYYYVRMAAAWGLSVCFVKFPEQTMAVLESGGLDDFTYQKALQKIVESNRVTAEDKAVIRGMKKARRVGI